MSTRSNIGIINADGSVLTIYCHSDGYPSGVGQTLLDHYMDEAKVRELLALGDISSLDQSPSTPPPGHSFDHRVDGFVTAYGRDRGEKGTEAKKHKTMADACKWCDNDYCYIFDPARGVWSFRNGDGPFSRLTPEACKE